MDIGFNTEPLREMEQILRELGQGKLEEFYKQILMELVLRLDAKVKLNTPVDTGNLRRNWRVGEVTKRGNVYEVEYFNNTEYAAAVEFGHRTRGGSDVRGRYMLTIGEAQLEEEIPQLLEQRIVEYIEAELSRLGG